MCHLRMVDNQVFTKRRMSSDLIINAPGKVAHLLSDKEIIALNGEFQNCRFCEGNIMKKIYAVNGSPSKLYI